MINPKYKAAFENDFNATESKIKEAKSLMVFFSVIAMIAFVILFFVSEPAFIILCVFSVLGFGIFAITEAQVLENSKKHLDFLIDCLK